MGDFQFEKEKAIASMLYICKVFGGECDKYAMLKILYFAERSHLVKYGIPITGDVYMTLPHGPVPSISYDAIKGSTVFGHFELLGKTSVRAINDPNLDELSDSDIECLDEAIEQNRHLDFFELKKKSHDDAYNNTKKEKGENAVMSYLDIAKAGGANENMIAYIKSFSETQNCILNAPNDR